MGVGHARNLGQYPKRSILGSETVVMLSEGVIGEVVYLVTSRIMASNHLCLHLSRIQVLLSSEPGGLSLALQMRLSFGEERLSFKL